MLDELKERNMLKLILIVRFACATLDVGHPIHPTGFWEIWTDFPILANGCIFPHNSLKKFDRFNMHRKFFISLDGITRNKIQKCDSHTEG
jgi:hypothetical protein